MRELLFSGATLFLLAANASAQTRITVDDSKIHAILRDSRTVLAIPLFNSLERSTTGHLALQWLDPKGATAASVERDAPIAPGGQVIEVPFPLPEEANALWLRLDYRLSPVLSDLRAFAPHSGTLALPEIADYPFELKIGSVGFARPGHPLIIRARAVHPATGKPIRGVRFEAMLHSGKQEIAPRSTVRDSLDFVSFTFDLPATLPKDPQLDVDIDGSVGDFSQSATLSANVLNQASATLQTDKPIYQPGQTVHIRGLLLAPSGRAAAGQEIEVTIEDSESDTAHHATLTSSKFGIFHDDWKLPSSAPLGDWTLRLELKDEGNQIATHRIRVSRYELPTFTVAATPDHEAYLPGQPARITVQGRYLFGKPVPKGKVRIVRFRELWEAKDDKEETEVAAGEADESGSFTASLGLDAAHQDLMAEDRARFKDLRFTAYMTDPSTGRKEQRRFDVRLTREPIHIYVIRPNGFSGSLPVPVYIAAYYANGKPAVTRVELEQGARTVQLRTNHFGVARALLAMSDEDVVVRAADSAGLLGNWQEQPWNQPGEGIRVETDKSIYREGQPVHVRVASTIVDGDVMVDAIVDGTPVASRSIRLTGGRGEIEFPFTSTFRRQVIFVAWNQRGVWGHKAIVFPALTDLRLAVVPEKNEYRPGDSAGVRMTLASAGGHPIAGVLGAAVVDQAVMGRARTDSEFGRRPWFSCGFCGSPDEVQVGGVSLNDIYNLDVTKPLPEGLDLVAEVLLANEDSQPQIESGDPYHGGQRKIFAKLLDKQFEPVKQALERHYNGTLEYPRNETELFRVLTGDALRDPWGTLYHPEFTVEGAYDVLQFVSAGPDKRLGTQDDFVAWRTRWRWFRLHEKLIRDALADQDYPSTPQEFNELLGQHGIRMETLLDRWGHPLRVNVSNWMRTRTIQLQSAGVDGKFHTADDVEVCRFQGPYFQRETTAIGEAVRTAGKTPSTEAEARELIRRAGVDLGSILDPWGRPYSVVLRTTSRYADRSRFTSVKVYQGAEQTRQDLTPVTQKLLTIAVHSAGFDGVEGTYDDFDVATFTAVLSEEGPTMTPPPAAAGRLPGTGSIAGVITDLSGAAIASATVKLIEPASGETAANESGAYSFTGLPSGMYALRFAAPGFQSGEVVRVPVESGHTTTVNFSLQVGSMNQTVTVEAAVPLLQTESVMLAAPATTATPRLRDYFPETLLWAPEVETDNLGRAHLSFKLADNITTWKVAVFASTDDGRTTETEADLRAFQPFFIDHNPPRVLTTGDQIDLPVTIRNYLEREQKVAVEMQPNTWSELRTSARQQVNVPSNGFTNVIYAIRATASEETARQRLTAIAAKTSDAIEKTLLVHPDGREVTQTTGDVATGRSSLKIAIPASAIAGATRGELRLYPGPLATLVEGLDGIIQRPYGCAEQTTSTGYANLIALRFLGSMGKRDPRLEARALENIGEARDRLLSFSAPGGGIGYWNRGDADVAVTAHALLFLMEASQFVPVDRDDLQPHVNWLQKHPQSKSPLLNAFAARALAAAQKAKFKVSATALAEAYHELAALTDSLAEPYTLASFALAAMDSGDSKLAQPAIAQLEKTAREERDGVFWDLKTNTPFHGWGTPGRVETSALAICALATWRQGHPDEADLDALIRRGLLFLLRHRDRYGVWYSTQATMRAMQALADASAVITELSNREDSIVEVRVNGRFARSVKLLASGLDPVLTDISPLLATGDNNVEVIPSHGGTAIVRLVTTHWTPWTESPGAADGELRLKVNFNRTEAATGHTIECNVEAERVGFRGYGMMLAEIGLPPGAEVDRASLDKVVEDSPGVDQYDVLPDRVVFYLWPHAGGAKFSFRFETRFAMQAKSGPASLFDYYNPEERAVISPQLFSIR